jgi:hypothetical protein
MCMLLLARTLASCAYMHVVGAHNIFVSCFQTIFWLIYALTSFSNQRKRNAVKKLYDDIVIISSHVMIIIGSSKEYVYVYVYMCVCVCVYIYMGLKLIRMHT